MSDGFKQEQGLPGQRNQQDTVRRCPACAALVHPVHTILDPAKGRTVRVFECECGELIWDDYTKTRLEAVPVR